MYLSIVQEKHALVCVICHELYICCKYSYVFKIVFLPIFPVIIIIIIIIIILAPQY